MVKSRAERKRDRDARNAEIDAADRAAAERLSGVSLERQPVPLFTDAAQDGRCPRCRGSQFRRPALSGSDAMGFGVLGLVFAALRNRQQTECITCGKRFRKG